MSQSIGFDITLTNWDSCPPQVRDELKRYQNNRLQVGGFLNAVLSNDLMSAVVRADPQNLQDLKAIIQFIWCEMQPLCFGSKEKVTAWLNREDFYR